MNTEELVEYLALGEKDASDLLNDIDQNISKRFKRACSTLAKIVDEVREVYPDANIYLANDTPNLLLGNPQSKSEKFCYIGGGVAQYELIACDSDKLKERIDGGDW